MTLLRAASGAALFFFALCRPLDAEDVTLTSRDGEVELSGTLLGFDGEFYRIDTIYGELTVDGSGVTCDGPACPSLQDFVAEIRISGASSMGSVMLPALIETFAQRNGYSVTRETRDASHRVYELKDTNTDRTVARFFFRLTNTDEGFADLLANEADIVMAAREARPDEVQRASEAGMGDVSDARRARVLALDAIVPVVAPDNPVRSVSPGDLARVFAGDIRNWSALGGPDAPISLYGPDAVSGLAQAFQRLVMDRSDLVQVSEIKRYSLGEDLAQAVAADPFGKVSVVIIADAASFRPLPVQRLARSCKWAVMRSKGSGSPITPVEAVKTRASGTLQASAVALVMAVTASTPLRPVKALEFPAFTKMAAALSLAPPSLA